MENEYLKKSNTRAIIGVVGCAVAVIITYIMAFASNYIIMGLPIVEIVMGAYFIIKIRNYKGKDTATNIIQDALIIIMASSAISMVISLIDYISYGEISLYLLVGLARLAYYAVFTLYLYGIFNKQQIISPKIYLIASIVYIASLFTGSIYNIIVVLYNIALIPYFYKYDYTLEKYAYKNEVKPVEVKKDSTSKGERNFTTLSDIKATNTNTKTLANEKKKLLIMAGIALLIALIF